MAIELICPGCSKKLRVGEEHAGKSARCPSCGTITPVRASAALHSSPDPSSPLSPTESPTPLTTAGSASPFSSSPSTYSPSSTSASPANSLGTTPSPFSSMNTGSQVGGAAAATGSSAGNPAGRWLLRADNGQTYGPIARAELDAWVQQGRVSATSYVIQEGGAQWQLASEIYPHLNPLRTSGSANPWAEVAQAPGGFAYPPPGGAYGYGMPGVYGGAGYKRPHRGVLVLVLGGLSWVFCFIFGIVAFSIGSMDVRAMKRGEMDDAGLGMTRAGMYLGLAHFVLTIGVVGFVIIMAILEEM